MYAGGAGVCNSPAPYTHTHSDALGSSKMGEKSISARSVYTSFVRLSSWSRCVQCSVYANLCGVYHNC